MKIPPHIKSIIRTIYSILHSYPRWIKISTRDHTIPFIYQHNNAHNSSSIIRQRLSKSIVVTFIYTLLSVLPTYHTSAQDNLNNNEVLEESTTSEEEDNNEDNEDINEDEEDNNEDNEDINEDEEDNNEGNEDINEDEEDNNENGPPKSDTGLTKKDNPTTQTIEEEPKYEQDNKPQPNEQTTIEENENPPTPNTVDNSYNGPTEDIPDHDNIPPNPHDDIDNEQIETDDTKDIYPEKKLEDNPEDNIKDKEDEPLQEEEEVEEEILVSEKDENLTIQREKEKILKERNKEKTTTKEKKINNISAVERILEFHQPTFIQLVDSLDIISRELSNNRSSSKLIYLKGVIYSKLSRKFLAIDNDGFNILMLSMKYLKELTKSKDAHPEYKSFAEQNIKEKYILYQNRAEKYYNKLNYHRCLECLNICRKIDPKNKAAFFTLARVHFKMKEYDSSLKYLQKYQQNIGKDPIIYYLKAIIYDDHKNDSKKALKYCEEGLKKFPFEDDLIRRKFAILKKINKFEDYDKKIKKTKFKKKGTLDYHLAHYYDITSDTKKAEKHYKKAANKASMAFYPQYSLGVIYYNKAINENKTLTLLQLVDLLKDKVKTKKVLQGKSDKQREKEKKEVKENAKKQVKLEEKINKLLDKSLTRLKKAKRIRGDVLDIEEIIEKINKYQEKHKVRKATEKNRFL